MSNKRSDLVAQISKAATFAEQREAVMALDDYDKNQRTAAQNARDLDWADAVVRETLSPVVSHEVQRNVTDTDWLGEYTGSANTHKAVAEASLWYSRISPEVKSDAHEFAIQAEGFMRREASKHGEQSEAVLAEGLNYLGFLWRKDGHDKTAASGLDQIQQTVDSQENPRPTPLDPTVFDNFADEVHPINQGVVGTETSDRAPLLQEIMQEGQGQGQPEKPGGHMETGDYSNSYTDVQPMGTLDAASGPLQQQAMFTPSLAINQTMTLDDFRRQAASGLDQIQQVVDAHENPAPTAEPLQVAFPWLISEDAYGNGDSPQDETDKAQTLASRKQAGNNLHFYGPDHSRNAHDSDGNYMGYYTSVGGGRSAKNVQWVYAPYGNDDSDRYADHVDSQASGYAGSHGEAMSALQQAHNKRLSKGASRKQADMFGGSDAPHPVADSSYSNEGVMDQSAANYAQGVVDAANPQARPSFADASSAVPAGVQQYSQGYSDNIAGGRQVGNGNNPVQMPSTAQPQATASRSNPAVIFHEMFGNVTRAQLAAYRKHNVSPADHDDLEDIYGKGNHAAITKAVKDPANQTDGNFEQWKHWQNSGARFSSKKTAYAPEQAEQDLNELPWAEHENGFTAEQSQDNRHEFHVFNPEGEHVDTDNLLNHVDVDGAPNSRHMEQALNSWVQRGHHSMNPKDYVGTAPSVRSASFTKAATASTADFRKGYNYARQWKPGGPLVSMGSADFESGLFAGLTDFNSHREAFRAAHRKQARKDPSFGQRLAQHDAYTDYLSDNGIDVTASTSTDLDTMAPGSSPTSNTPINGPGTVPPLAGLADPAAPGGPAPYNGVPPYGVAVVPTGPGSMGLPSPGYVNVDPNQQLDRTKALAFRRTVQANLVSLNQQKG